MCSRAISTHPTPERGCFGSLLCALPGCALAVSAWAQGGVAPLPEPRIVEPRAYGYFVGDVLQRRVHIDVPAGLTLDLASLPRARRPGQALELRRAEWHGGPELLLEYQVFLAPAEVRTLEVAPLRLRFIDSKGVNAVGGAGGERSLRIDAWPVTVAPLLPQPAPARTGLGDWQPDVPPPLLDTAPVRARLQLWAALLLLPALWLAQVYLGLPWWRRHQRPFAQAWRVIGALPQPPQPDACRQAFQRLHAALNASAGQVLFAQGVDAFIAAQPRYAALQPALRAFFEDSQRLFFAAAAGPVDPQTLQRLGRALQTLSRALRDAERGSR